MAQIEEGTMLAWIQSKDKAHQALSRISVQWDLFSGSWPLPNSCLHLFFLSSAVLLYHCYATFDWYRPWEEKSHVITGRNHPRKRLGDRQFCSWRWKIFSLIKSPHFPQKWHLPEAWAVWWARAHCHIFVPVCRQQCLLLAFLLLSVYFSSFTYYILHIPPCLIPNSTMVEANNPSWGISLFSFYCLHTWGMGHPSSNP